jgi:sugar O-acyltransferase (sialic acid O-acetyltransferase NeuD family)
MPQLIIIGAGALAREVHSLFHEQYDILGFLDKPHYPNEQINGCPVIDKLQLGCEYIIAVADPYKKKALTEKYLICDTTSKDIIEHSNLPFARLIHPTAIISDYTYVPKSTIIFPYAIIDPNVKFGKHTFIGYHAFVGHHAEIGDYSTIFTGASISGYTKLKIGAYMGAHSCTVNEHHQQNCVSLGKFCRVGAGAVVTENVEDGKTVVGIPAQPL